MKNNEYYNKLEERFKSERPELNSFLEADDGVDDQAILYPTLSSIQTQQERYINFRHVAEGGEKTIEAAFDTISEREVAVARPKKNDPTTHERFLREARLTALLQHPNIMPIYDIGLENGSPYFTMEIIQGENLAKIRQADKTSKEVLDECLSALLKVCDAIAFAHDKGLAHLDIKPQNIQTGRFGKVLLCDWGLSLIIDEKERKNDSIKSLDKGLAIDLTINGVLKGTPGFMSPNLCDGNRGTFQDDIYALGCTLYYILTSEVPFQHKSDLQSIIHATKNEGVPSPQVLFSDLDIPNALNAMVLKATAKEDGYNSVDELRKDLQNYLRGYATEAESPSFLTHLKLLYKRQKVLCNTILAALILIVAITSFFIFSLQQERVKEFQARIAAETAKQESESSLHMYKNELRFNRYLMDGIDQSLKEIINEVNDKQLPVDIQSILVKVGRDNINTEAYEAAAQMLLTLTENSTGETRFDALHDLIFLRIFMHNFEGALSLLQKLPEAELKRADIYQFIELCEIFKNKDKKRDVLQLKDFRDFLHKVDQHQRPREWFDKHTLSYYQRKCNTDEEFINLYKLVLELKDPQKGFSVILKTTNGQKSLSFTSPEKVDQLILPTLLNSLDLDLLDLSGTKINSLDGFRQVSVKAIDISQTEIVNLSPLSLVLELKKVYLDSGKKYKGVNKLKVKGVSLIPK
ncbi:MAG: serine/threonine protein kinase [Lentisphaeraceae bacterium]|nr:serine/threonine protein kinase [Lentisphaeraceae bacterium]